MKRKKKLGDVFFPTYGLVVLAAGLCSHMPISEQPYALLKQQYGEEAAHKASGAFNSTAITHMILFVVLQ